MPTTTAPEIVEIRTVEEAVALLDRWISAYQELRRDYLRLQVRCGDAEFWRDAHASTLEHLDPFLPPDMHNPRWLAEKPRIYAAIAELLEEQKVPF